MLSSVILKRVKLLLYNILYFIRIRNTKDTSKEYYRLLKISFLKIINFINNHIFLFQIQWADACLLVYSVTDRSSFEYATEILNTLKRTPTHSSPAHAPTGASSGMPLALLGNKTDLDHLRQVRI